MTPEALIFGGIGSLAECAQIDRNAWNSAFRADDVPWDWSWDTYAILCGDVTCMALNPEALTRARRGGLVTAAQ